MNLMTISRLPDDMPGTLGAPIRREQQKPEHPGRWVPASEPHYLRHTKSGAVSHEQFVPASERPTKPAPGLHLESGEFVPAEELNKSVRDDGPCGVVPSQDEMNKAAFRIGPSHWKTTLAIPGLEGISSVYDIPADRRADVIKALNELGS